MTKPQIEKLLKDGALQMELFDAEVCEVAVDGRRLVVRRNPMRAREMAKVREDKRAALDKLVAERNAYLEAHPRAKAETALTAVQAKIEKLRVAGWLGVRAEARALALEVDEAALAAESRLDGCYVLETDVDDKAADAQTVHDRYKDLALVENAFRVSKTGHLELRPIYVRSEKSTRGHVFVVMLAYLIRRELQRAWAHLDVTVEEGLDSLKTLCIMHVRLPGGRELHQVPTPREQSKALLDALGLEPPPCMPKSAVRVATKRKLAEGRLTR